MPTGFLCLSTMLLATMNISNSSQRYHLIIKIDRIKLGHTNYILLMTDPDRPFYVMSEEKIIKIKMSIQLLSEER